MAENLKIVRYDEKEWLDIPAPSRAGARKRLKNLLTENELKSKGHSVKIVSMPADTEIKAHYHKQTVEIFYVLKGNAMFLFDDKRFKAQQGDILLCEPGDVHDILNNTDKELLFLVFKINAEKNDVHRIK